MLFRSLWPRVCSYCLEKESKDYEIEKTIYYGSFSKTFTISIPLCENHYQIVNKRTEMQSMLSKYVIPAVSIGVSILFFFLYMMLVEASFGLKIIVALIIAFSSLVTIWIALDFKVIRLFADPETKKVKNSVKIKKFWPPDTYLYEFDNPGFADKVIGLNQSNIISQ